jgi:hypothetical protein
MAQNSLTYYIDSENKRMTSMVDSIDSILQAVFKALGTQKYGHEIYSWEYGFLEDQFVGEDLDFIQTNLEYYIRECLSKDDRILDITNFKVQQQSIDSCLATFDILSSEGLIENVTKEFKYGN